MRMLVTAGPTREPIDPVRYLSNHSSGKMGYAIARAALAAGHRVTLVSGPTCLTPPEGAALHSVTTAIEMRDVVIGLAGTMDCAILAAAVADFRPAEFSPGKIKKSEVGGMTLRLVRNPDILAELGAMQTRPLLVGFAAETTRLVANARIKLAAKNCDLIVANSVDPAGSVFGSDSNTVTVLGRDGQRRDIGPATKQAVAEALVRIIDDI